ncbi:MAG: hypothetical protein IT254_10385 [Chitinophagaceae bacterium]|nr:hypothetical protein [Chitinophagaceae bacterium]MCW5916058.1 hypothetical protein [Ferruginibacter sp.]
MQSKNIFILFLTCIFYLPSYAQGRYKEFKLNQNGDTLNAILPDGKKSGKWVIHVDELRGEPGYEEEGVYKKGEKDGFWRKYNLEGDLIGVEHFVLGSKDGLQQYFTYLGDLVREENWKGYNPEAPYDTVAIYGMDNNEILEYKLVPAAPYAVKHGEWRYYEPGSGRLIRTEQWDHNNLVKPKPPTKEPEVASNGKKKEVEKTPEMLKWEQKNKNKKKALRDGRTGL